MVNLKRITNGMLVGITSLLSATETVLYEKKMYEAIQELYSKDLFIPMHSIILYGVNTIGLVTVTGLLAKLTVDIFKGKYDF